MATTPSSLGEGGTCFGPWLGRRWWPQNIYALTRADFWALAGIYAVDKAIALANAACDSDDCLVPDSGLVFQWGRQVRLN